MKGERELVGIEASLHLIFTGTATSSLCIATDFYFFPPLSTTFRVHLMNFASRWAMFWGMEGFWKSWSKLEMAHLSPTMLPYWVLQQKLCSKHIHAFAKTAVLYLNVLISVFFIPLVHYSGYLEYSNVPFETNTYQRFPKIMKLGRGQQLASVLPVHLCTGAAHCEIPV